MRNLDGRVVPVTGASRGSGTIALAFGREGAMVAVNHRRRATSADGLTR
jgi:NAD(P)-dependent dehydrogenase (short-subunit alcohol dehydrogenase family)